MQRELALALKILLGTDEGARKATNQTRNDVQTTIDTIEDSRYSTQEEFHDCIITDYINKYCVHMTQEEKELVARSIIMGGLIQSF